MSTRAVVAAELSPLRDGSNEDGDAEPLVPLPLSETEQARGSSKRNELKSTRNDLSQEFLMDGNYTFTRPPDNLPRMAEAVPEGA